VDLGGLEVQAIRALPQAEAAAVSAVVPQGAHCLVPAALELSRALAQAVMVEMGVSLPELAAHPVVAVVGVLGEAAVESPAPLVPVGIMAATADLEEAVAAVLLADPAGMVVSAGVAVQETSVGRVALEAAEGPGLAAVV